MSIKSTTIKTSSLLTVLCLSAALAITSCGKKTATTTTEPATTPATGASTAPTTGASTAPGASTGAPLSATEKAKLTPVKTALVMANTAIKGGDVTKAKAQFAKFSSVWPTVEPIVKAKAGASYPAMASGIETAKTALNGATPDKAKAGEGLTAALNAMNALLAKK
jgi:hypothetical protein